MRLRVPEPKGKLDTMTGYSFSTPVWNGGQWTAPVVAEVTAAARIVNGPEDQPRTAPAQWDRIDWRAQEEQVRRLGIRRPRHRRLPGQVLLDGHRTARAGRGRGIPPSPR